MAKTKKAGLEAEFKHGTSIGANGEILYDCPIEIKGQADLDNYGIGWDDCKTLNFHGSEKMTVYFFKTENRAFAESQWSYLDTQHSSGYYSVRCMVPGKRKAFIKCRDTNKCSACPYGMTPETKQASLAQRRMSFGPSAFSTPRRKRTATAAARVIQRSKMSFLPFVFISFSFFS